MDFFLPVRPGEGKDPSREAIAEGLVEFIRVNDRQGYTGSAERKSCADSL